MLYAKQATGTVEKVSRRLIAAASARGLKLVGRHLMKWNHPLFEDVPLRECRILEFSNIVKFRRILEASPCAAAAPAGSRSTARRERSPSRRFVQRRSYELPVTAT